MEIISKLSLIIHIAAGFTALVTGAIAIFTKKGGKAHISSGKVYYWAMTLVALTAIIISIYKNITFLLLIGIFSYYLTLTGYRSIKMKGQKLERPAAALDWVVFGISLLTSLVMMVLSIMQLLPLPEAVGLFGAIMLVFCWEDYKYFTQKTADKQWLYRHIRRMCGAYIATFTAFLVVNIETEPAFIAWILPTVIGTPLIIFTIRKYKAKFAKRDAPPVA